MYYIGVDLGTSAVKLLLMEGSGKICNIVSKEYPLFFPHPGWSEQNPEDWFAQSMEGIKELTEGIDRKEVAGIGFGGQMHGLVTLDKDDNVIRPAILWNDGRTGEETEYLNTVIGKEKLSQYTANIAFAGFTAPKILWMQKHEPENFKKVVKIMLPKDYLAYRLSGSFCTDVSDASGMLLLDVKNRCWSKEMLEICHITEEQLPKLYESWQVVGTLKPEVAKELGIDEVHAELLPADKVAQVERLLREKPKKEKLAFVGDGINDGPVLAAADLGIAMGMGSDLATQTADMVLMSNNLKGIPAAIRACRKGMRIARGNIVFILIVKALVLTLGALGYAPMAAAIFADVGVTLITVLNSLRILKVRKE